MRVLLIIGLVALGGSPFASAASAQKSWPSVAPTIDPLAPMPRPPSEVKLLCYWDQPLASSVTNRPITVIVGVARPGTWIAVNDDPALQVHREMEFSVALDLHVGANELVVQCGRGRQRIIERRTIYYYEPVTVAQLHNRVTAQQQSLREIDLQRRDLESMLATLVDLTLVLPPPQRAIVADDIKALRADITLVAREQRALDADIRGTSRIVQQMLAPTIALE